MHLGGRKEDGMLADRLVKAWTARRGSSGIDAVMRFSREGLVLGAGTVLARAEDAAREIMIDPLDRRLPALLAAAHMLQPSILGLAHLRKAAECWRRGEDAFATLHLALSGLDRLDQPEADAYRLFLADALLEYGVEPEAITKAVESGPAALEQLRKYSPDQPRVPAGSGRISGQWTADDNSPGSTPPDADGADNVTSGQGSVQPANTAQPAGDAQENEVNPNTITPAGFVSGDHVCRLAKQDCWKHQLEDVSDAANDNWSPIAVGACTLAEKACEKGRVCC